MSSFIYQFGLNLWARLRRQSRFVLTSTDDQTFLILGQNRIYQRRDIFDLLILIGIIVSKYQVLDLFIILLAHSIVLKFFPRLNISLAFTCSLSIILLLVFFSLTQLTFSLLGPWSGSFQWILRLIWFLWKSDIRVHFLLVASLRSSLCRHIGLLLLDQHY